MAWLKHAAFSLAGLVFGAGVYLGWEEEVRQPLSFNHQAHASLACAACHQGVEARARAGIPGASFCVRCHATPPVTQPEELRRWAQLDQGGMEWQRLYQVPDHVYFSHRRHVAQGRLDCAICHGDMAERTSPPPRPLVAVSMDACLNCHQQQVSADCAACHR